MRTYKLHELIEMAEKGEKFRARYISSSQNRGWYNEGFFIYHPDENWKAEAIIADWEVQLKRDPRIVWVRKQNNQIYSNVDLLILEEGEQLNFTEVIKDLK